jgi:adhesin transport system membrane fusion protein
MSWIDQAKLFFKEVKEAKVKKDDQEEPNVTKEDLEFVSSSSEARLLSAPSGASFLIALTSILLLVLLTWSFVMPVDEVVKAQGKVIPSKQVQVIQNLEGGIIKEIKVFEGQNVQKGEELIIINDVAAASDLSDNAKQYNMLLARLVALNTLIEGKRVLNFPKELEPFIDIMAQAREQFNAEWKHRMSKIVEIEDGINQKKSDLDAAKNDFNIAKNDYELAKEELKLNEKAFKEQIIPRVTYIQSEHDANAKKAKFKQAKSEVVKAKSELHEYMQRRESYLHESTTEFEKERAEIKSKLNTMQSKGVSLKAKVSHSKVTSPVVGTVKKINFNTVGGVIRPGMDIMEIIPTDDKLIIEVKVKPKDIGFIHTGLPAKVKLTAFDYSTYGGLDGKVIFVSADTITDKKGASFFLVRVKTDKNYIVDKKGKKHTIRPGMQAETDIVVDSKSIMSYILKPMLK